LNELFQQADLTL